MAKGTEETTDVPVESVPVEVVQDDALVAITLNEYCIRLSTTDNRVELIGGFEFVERHAGRNRDTYDNYAARYADFLTKEPA